ncbi:hypothetical protein COL154_011283 [Colletotrichum chrysophilum]|uniref:Ankyrin repeat protein n=1 Tax=Colletotrichum chrysophilum TaxID=1836956 RepID=A0AAD9A562_9PEZI|nr:uncharacterized protein COL26b_011587 [Colletotrichum chrysophilum]KAJ0343449.1 hypothetical protein KNSL1_010308 [Colletotrichum chrysophilum]KAJ0355741.1 hypothetical protein COL154_011283 [Colletotrichum chrysophilum]KAJ0366652.1 hypothetical protein COL26b_011587 [Colletotrichum chrysophilum]KAK1841513.1 hypothetical protein CCHR01_15874 [Colletotrichum chrysophilum]
MSNFFSTLQQYARPLATVAAGAFLARAMAFPDNNGPDGQSSTQQVPGEYKPTLADVLVVRVMLEKAAKFPPELLDLIFDQAEYWPHSEASMAWQVNVPRGGAGIVGGDPNGENKLLLRCPPIGFTDYRKVGEAFKTAPLPPKDVDGSAVEGPLQNLTLMEPKSSPTLPTREAPREYFEGSMTQPPALTHPVRKIVFKLRSKDQGWGGSHEDKGTYRGSWTWFEAGLEKFDEGRKCDGSCKRSSPSPTPEPEASESSNTPGGGASNFCTCGLQSVYPPVVSTSSMTAYHHHMHALDNLKIQANKTAHREFVDHEVIWSWTDDIHPDSPEGDRLAEIGRGKGTGTGNFVRSLKLGDVVTVWGKARFGGWRNNVESVKVEIYWAI